MEDQLLTCEWTYQGKLFNPEELEETYAGFVYLITNTTTGKKYIGKKKLAVFKKVKYKPSKKTGKKKRTKTVNKESDWRTYFGSSRNLLEDVQALGQDKFTREVLVLCKKTAEMSYWETKLQLENDVLLKPEEYYNEYVGCRISRSHVLKC